MLLVLLTDQVLCLKHHHLHHLEKSAELDEVVDVVSGQPRSRLGVGPQGQIFVRDLKVRGFLLCLPLFNEVQKFQNFLKLSRTF